jgi:hypothetical protein
MGVFLLDVRASVAAALAGAIPGLRTTRRRRLETV